MMANCANETDDRDEEKEDSAGRDASDDGKTGDDSGGLAMDGHSDHEEGDHHVNNIQAHKGVFGAGETPAHCE